jgi:hypothetical protein
VIPPNATDGRALSYSYYNIHVPLDLVASTDIANANNGYAQFPGHYFGGQVYQGDDSGSYEVIPVIGRYRHVYQLVSSQVNSYSVKAQGSLDGTTWVDADTAQTSDTQRAFAALYKFLRFNISALDIAGQVASVTVTNGGSGYTSAPLVTFSAPDDPAGVQATGTAVLTLDAVTSVTMTNIGSGYASAPTVTFTGGGGTLAAGTAVLSTGTLNLGLKSGLKIIYIAIGE